MKNIILMFIAVILGIIYVYMGSTESTSFLLDNLNIYNEKNEVINTTIENYVVGVVAAEMPASFEEEALKAQAIAARTFIYHKLSIDPDFKITSSQNFQAYITKDQMQKKWGKDFDKYYKKIFNAVSLTKNLVITYNNELIKSYYFSMSNGYTENVSNVFGESEPYLISVESLENSTINNYEVVMSFSKLEFLNLLNDNSDKVIVNNIEYDDTHHVKTVVINNKKYSGVELRKLLNLRSTDFKIDVSDDIIITTYGYGHDVGMSQYGANIMAKKGKNYKDIICHYYTGVEIVNLNSIKY